MASEAEKETRVKQVVDPGSDVASTEATVESLRGIASLRLIDNEGPKRIAD
jgi:hypothetical protein